MAINIKVQSLIPTRRDGQNALSISGGYATITIGTNSSSGTVDTTGLLKEASLNMSTFKWNVGLLEPSVAGGGVSQAYVDGSLAKRDASLNILYSGLADVSSWIIRTTSFTPSTETLTLFLRNAGTLTPQLTGAWLREVSMGTSLYWTGGKYEVSTGFAFKNYLDGSLATRDSSIIDLYSKVGGGGASVAYVDGSLAKRDSSITDLYSKVGGVTQSYVDGSLATRDSSIIDLYSHGGDLCFGNGVDGDVTISGTTTLTREMYYNNLTVNTGQILNTAGFRIYVKGTFTLTGTGSVQCKGGNGGNGTGSVGGGGVGGTAPYTTQRFPFQPVPGGGGDGGATGGAGTANGGASPAGQAIALSLAGTTNYPIQLYVGAGATGGGGHGATPTAGLAGTPTYIFYGAVGKAGGTATGAASAALGGGGGGAGGGCMVIYAKTISGSGSFSVVGGTGGNGMTSSTTYSGNGSGGNGGSVTVYYRTQSSWTGTLVATGGSAGTGGTAGVAGTAGVTSLVVI